ncbi:ig-like domain-containing protein [Caerostris darwini]|uniref:Ig-like domain-containing protein n=1 Tax=Caerostris darwini TaxID=1538125 RepID=A0AAV4VWS6_9ARAC|nr:ig-like domain-containing protein [Caerostris darwini]
MQRGRKRASDSEINYRSFRKKFLSAPKRKQQKSSTCKQIGVQRGRKRASEESSLKIIIVHLGSFHELRPGRCWWDAQNVEQAEKENQNFEIPFAAGALKIYAIHISKVNDKKHHYVSITFWGTPEHQVGKEDTDFMVLCNVRSDPSPIISWYVNNSLILDGPKYTITEDGLFIRSLKPTDSGNYTCRAFVVTPHSSQMKDRGITVHVHCTVRFFVIYEYF